MVVPVGDVNPTRRRAVVTGLLVLLNAAVFLLVQAPAEGCEAQVLVYRYGAVPAEIVAGGALGPSEAQPALGPCAAELDTGPVAVSLLTAMFLHGNLAHLAGNLLFLAIFGNNVEDRLGHLRFLGFYLGGGVVATLAHTALQPDSIVPLIGASGAIAAILGAYLVCFPRAKVLTFVPFPLYLVAIVVPGLRIRSWWVLFAIVSLPAWLLLGGWFALQAAAARSPVDAGVAYEAHVAGFVAGIVLVWLLDAGRRRRGRSTFHPVRERSRR